MADPGLAISGDIQVDGAWTSPPPARRAGATGIYDEGRNRMIVFGGRFSNTYFNDCWALTLGDRPEWRRLAPQGTAPSPRWAHAAVYDPARQRMIVHGGWDVHGSGPVNDETWSLSLAGTLVWEQLSTTGVAPARYGHSAIYDPVRDRMIVFGGYAVWSYVGSNQVYALALDGATHWSEVPVSEGDQPSGLASHSAIYDHLSDRMVVYGGSVAGGGTSQAVWSLDFAPAPVWSNITPSYDTSYASQGHDAVFDPVNNRMVVIGGSVDGIRALPFTGPPTWESVATVGHSPSLASGCAIYDGSAGRLVVATGYADGEPSPAWAFSFSGSAWEQLASPGFASNPESSGEYTLTYDPPRDRMVLLGGRSFFALDLRGEPDWTASSLTVNTSSLASHTTVYDPDGDRLIVYGAMSNPGPFSVALDGTAALEVLATSGGTPDPRYDHSAIYDSMRNRMIVFGGRVFPFVYNDVWALDLDGVPMWTQLAFSGTQPPLRYRHAAVYDPVDDRMIIFGGMDENWRPCSDTWSLSFADARWEEILPGGIVPPAIARASAVYDPVRRRMVVIGGEASSRPLALALGGPAAWSRLEPEGGLPEEDLVRQVVSYDPIWNQMLVMPNGAPDLYSLMWGAATLDLTAPNGSPADVWPTPGGKKITWDYFGGVLPHHWRLAYSTDGGGHYRDIDDHATITGPPYEYSWLVPPIGSARFRIRVQAMDAAGTVLAGAESASDQVLYNRYGVHFIHENGVNGEHVSDTAAVIRWQTIPTAERYRVTIEKGDSSTCVGGGIQVLRGTVETDPGTGVLPAYFEIPWSDYSGLPAAKYHVYVESYAEATGYEIIFEEDFLVCRLGDLDPFDNETKEPIMLVHGWSSDSSTWYPEGSTTSELVESLIAGDGSQPSKRHPWTFEYPNIGSIRASGAALGEAIAYVEHLSGQPSVSVIAHSMGGLVCRAYLQDECDPPKIGGYPPYRGDIDRFVTLSTPHLGASQERTAAFFKDLAPFSCNEILGSQSVTDLDGGSDFIADLSGHPLPGGTECFLAAGREAFGEMFSETRNTILNTNCPYGNDGTVDVCSATGGRCDGDYTHEPLDVGSATVVYRDYDLSHPRMSLPGFLIDGELDRRRDAAQDLLRDVLRFCRFGPTGMDSDDCELPATTQVEFECETTPAYIGMKASYGTLRGGIGARYGALEIGDPLAGARITIQHLADVGSSVSQVRYTGSSGHASLSLRPGEYALAVDAPGVLPRNETIIISDPPGNIHWTLGLVLDATADAPGNPSIVIESGAASTADPTVTVALSCDGAAEYMISEFPDFNDASWLPFVATVPWSFDATPGWKTLHARFRNGAGITSHTVTDAITMTAAPTGRIAVSSTPAGYPIVLNQALTGAVTPTVLDGLTSGYYGISLVAPGMIIDPASITAEVAPGGTASVVFDLAEAPAPAAVDLTTLGAENYLSGEPFDWATPAGGARFYNVTVSADSLRETVLWRKVGVSGSEVALGEAIPDSDRYFVSIESVSGQGAVQTDGLSSRPIWLDHTPPSLNLVEPAPGDTLAPDELISLVTTAQDWSGIAGFWSVLSPDGGSSYPDTLWAGTWAPSLDVTVPVHGLADSCLVLVGARDLAGNVAFAVSDSFLVIHDGVTSVTESPRPSRFGFIITGGNPHSSESRMAVTVPEGARARIDVFDVRGFKIKTLLDERIAGGRRAVTWDGKDAAGRRVAGGVYLMALRSGERLAVRKITVVR